MSLVSLVAVLAVGAAQNSSTIAASTTIDGPQSTRIDVNHSTLSFSVRHFGITKIRGQFNEWSGTILWNEGDITRSTVAVALKTASVDTRHTRRDADLVGADFFDSEQFPAIVLRSSKIERVSDNYVMHAHLTIRDITREVEIPFEFLGVQEVRGKRIFAAGTFAINRSDYDLARENRLARSLGVVSDKVEFELDIQGVVADPGGGQFNSRAKPSVGETLAKIAETDGPGAALERFNAIKTSSPDDYNLATRELLVLVDRLRVAGQSATALELSAALAEESPSPDWYVLRARTYIDADNESAAEQELMKALELDAYHTPALALLQTLEVASQDR